VRDDPDTNGSELMVVDGDGPNLIATLPQVPDDTVIRYRVVVEMSDTTQRRLPDNAADPHYDAYFGETEAVYCTGFTNPDIVELWDHDWEWGPPDGENGTGDPRVGHTPTFVLGTDNGWGNDDGVYGPNQSFAASSPPIDTMGYPGVRLQYYRWLDVEDGHFDRAAIAANGTTVWSNLDSNMGDDSTTHHQDREWRFHDVDISDHVVDGRVQLEFTLDTDATNHFAGWSIDSLCIMGTGEPVRTPDAGPAPTVDASPPAGTDAGGAMPGPGGCGCRTTGDSTAGWMLLLALALATSRPFRRRPACCGRRRRHRRADRTR
jgi:MYXO-CTERM domain-containing protein